MAAAVGLVLAGALAPAAGAADAPAGACAEVLALERDVSAAIVRGDAVARYE